MIKHGIGGAAPQIKQTRLSAQLSMLISMAAGRPDLPRQLRRALLIEAGHRCAIPTCSATLVEFAHIVPWSKTHEHDFANMIALCPNCHTRFDRGEIDRTAMFAYKAALGERKVRHLKLLDAYRTFQTTVESWSYSIGAIELANVADDDTSSLEALVEECCAWAGIAQDAATALGEVASVAVIQQAEWLHVVQHWADDVMNGLWPSTHQGADGHGAELDGLGSLHAAICGELGLTQDQLPLQRMCRPGAPAVR